MKPHNSAHIGPILTSGLTLLFYNTEPLAALVQFEPFSSQLTALNQGFTMVPKCFKLDQCSQCYGPIKLNHWYQFPMSCTLSIGGNPKSTIAQKPDAEYASAYLNYLAKYKLPLHVRDSKWKFKFFDSCSGNEIRDFNLSSVEITREFAVLYNL